MDLEPYGVTPEQVRDDVVALAEDGAAGRLLGFYCLVLAGPPELELMVVADEAQGRGVGRALFGHMLAAAADHGADSVAIIAHPPAEGFYLRMGARRVGVRPALPPIVPWERPVLVVAVPSLSSSRLACDREA